MLWCLIPYTWLLLLLGICLCGPSMFLEEVKLYCFFLQHAMCIASFILHCIIHVPKVTTVLVQHLGCSSIPCWVCRQKTLYCTHMHLKYCWKRCHCYFYWKFVHYILFYHWFVTEVQFYIKLLFNWTCGLNSSSKQICLLRCFHLTLMLLFSGTWWLLGGKGISWMSHLIRLEAFVFKT
jgi:hypothetical protein